MLQQVLIVLSFAVGIYWIAPKVAIEPRPLTSPISKDVLTPPKDVRVISWNNAEKKFHNQIVGPESLTHNPETGEIYTGTFDGMVWKINKDMTEATPLLRIGKDHQDCGADHVSHICGRILGLKFLAPDTVIVVDSYNGIIAVHLSTLTKEVLVAPDQDALTNSLKLFNSVEISSTGILYFTVSSMRWDLHDFIYSALESEDTGRVYSYTLKTKELKLLVTNIPFANGVALTPDEKSLLVCHIFDRRIFKYNLQNLKEKPKIWVDNLPGYPDNIKRVHLKNFYYVALPTLTSENLFPFIRKYPFVGKLIAWFVPKSLIMSFGSYNTQAYKFNEHGQVVAIINGTGLQTSFITEAYPIGDKVIMGNLKETYVAVVDAK